MPNELIVKSSVTLNAPISTVWDALINPEQTKQYMFGCEALSDWKVNSPILWKGVWEGQEMVFVIGTIVQIVPEFFLAYTAFDPNSTLDDIPENYVTITYSLSESNGQTHLAITQGDYATVADGERRYVEAYNGGEGWNPILADIKKLVETSSTTNAVNS